MKIKGLQKTTLIDYPNEIACTIFLSGCNFKCRFCHNPELVLGFGSEKLKEYSQEEILEFLEKKKKYLSGACITGGEPLMTLDLEFLKKIKELDYKIKIDTNGSFPKKLKEVIDLKLVDFIAMDIKTSKEDYNKVCNSKIDLKKIEESIKLIHKFRNYEFRTTILESIHSKEDFEKMMKWVSKICNGKIKKFSLQGFKNSGKLIDEKFSEEKNTSEIYLEKLKEIALTYCENVEIRV